MGAIVDVLHLGQKELCLIKVEYPNCLAINQTNSSHIIQKYRVIIPDEDEDSYYMFLLDNRIATSSANFLCRVENDPKFAESMRARMADHIENSRDRKKLLKSGFIEQGKPFA